MMAPAVDIADLRMRAERVREFEHRIGAAVFSLRHPNRFEVERLWARTRGDMVAGMRDIVRASVIGWRGVLIGDALPESKQAADALPFDVEALDLVLDERVDWIDTLGRAIVERIKARQDSIEADRKNSQTECDTSAAAAAATNSPPSVSTG